MLQGTLDVFSLDEVLGLLSGANKTGVLNITGDRGVGSVSIADGHLVGGSASSAPEANELPDVVFELLRYDEGSFSFDGGATAEGDPQDLASVMDEAHRRLDEWKGIEAVVPSLDHRLALCPTLSTSQVTLSESEWAAIVAVGEGATVGVVARRLGLGEFDGSKRVKALIERSLAEITESSSAVEAPDTTVFATPEPAPASFAEVVTPAVEEPAAFAPQEVATDEAPAFEDAEITAEDLDTEIPPMPEAPSPASFEDAAPAAFDDEAASEIPPMPAAPSLDSFGDIGGEAPEAEIPPMPEPPSFGDMTDAPMPPAPAFDGGFDAPSAVDAAPVEPSSFGGLDPIVNEDIFEAPRRKNELSTDTFGADGFAAEALEHGDIEAPMPPPPASSDSLPSFAPPADFDADAFAPSGETMVDDETGDADAEQEKGGSLLMRYLKSNG